MPAFLTLRGHFDAQIKYFESTLKNTEGCICKV